MQYFQLFLYSNKKDAEKFLLSLEDTENKERRKLEYDELVETLKDKMTIRKMFK